MRFVGSPGFAHGGDFLAYARDTFDQLYEEGAELPRAVARLLDHMAARDGAWFARRADIAQHWIKRQPPLAADPPADAGAT